MSKKGNQGGPGVPKKKVSCQTGDDGEILCDDNGKPIRKPKREKPKFWVGASPEDECRVHLGNGEFGSTIKHSY